MRLRNDPNAIEFLNSHPSIFINNSKQYKGKWNLLFKNNNSISIEIGMGKGQFIIQQAINHPNINFIGIEKNWVICAKAVKKYLNLNTSLDNLRFCQMDAKLLKENFQTNEINHIFLNFSDPWPKKRHFKNRLTALSFLNDYAIILKKNSYIELKTDNDDFFNWSLDIISNHPAFETVYSTNNLYQNLKDAYNIDNIATEYEDRFVAINKNINKLLIKLKK